MVAETCFCGKTEPEHMGLHHEFSPNGELKVQKEPRRTETTSGVFTIDVVLRMVLIDRGIISAEDLALKEAELRDKLRRSTTNSPQLRNTG